MFEHNTEKEEEKTAWNQSEYRLSFLLEEKSNVRKENEQNERKRSSFSFDK